MAAIYRGFLLACLGMAVVSVSYVGAETESESGATASSAEHSEESGHGDHGDHGADSEGVNPNPLTIDPDLAVFTAIIFLMLLAFLGKFAWKPIMEGLDKRESAIEQQIESANDNAAKAEATLRDYEAKLTAAADEVKSIVAEARRDAEVTRDKIVAEAQATAQRERERSIADIEVAKNLALDEVAKTGADLAVDLAGKIVHDELDRGKHAQLISDALSKLPSNN